ncbi:retron system putative HNH endonuclease [Cronbergia sp. UHCC 0137]|uniref:retron system putative HNH endonuclease n=1 Tax=Cronbergia sp. UHCC 0137 TaxID=3110239 RepID=UPI002B1EF41B|nr:retron system putative HNH endonuclease [Cronbergia sp. UHCC 0137]MEA5620268.1 retron system putative HNH endonuclease [Cronbergia sp. UHCC 0137]
MKQIIKGTEPLCLLKHRQTDQASYENYSPKEPLKKALLIEQGYICCYCMRRISEENMEIEHWKPMSINKYPELQIDYKNLLASCSGNRGNRKTNQHCNPRKGDEEITINPADSKSCEIYIKYSSTGKILSDDETINYELNEILNLNLETLKDNRTTALNAVIDALKRKFANKTWTKEAIAKKLNEFNSKDAEGKYSEYCQYIVCYLNKRL